MIRVVRSYRGVYHDYTKTDTFPSNPEDVESSLLDDTVILVDYDLVPSYIGDNDQLNQRIMSEHGTLEFEREHWELPVYFRIYKRMFHEDNKELT